MKKLMILGAGIYQVPLIKKAKEMGLYTIAVSCPGPYPGLSLADKTYPIDTTDSLQLLKAASEENIDGVCTSGTDVAVRSLGYLCDALDLPGISGHAAHILTDKAKMKEAFLKGGVSTPASLMVHSLNEAMDAFHHLGSPVMVKAVDSSGSRGITKAESAGELEESYHKSMQVTKKDYILVESFIDGHEIGVDGFVLDGKPELLLPHDKFVHTSGKTTLPAGHHFPFHCSDALASEIRHQIELVISSAKMNNCAVNADVLIQGNRVFILEAGGRAGATCIPELMSLYGGFDYYEQMILSALGMPADFAMHSSTPCMSKLLFTKKSGILTYVDYAFLDVLNRRGILASLDYALGAVVPAVHDGTDRIGQVIMKTDLEKELDDVMNQLRAHIKIDGVTLDQLWNE